MSFSGSSVVQEPLISADLLGIYVSYADVYHVPEIIPITRIDSPLALIPIYSQVIRHKLWVTVSFDVSAQEKYIDCSRYLYKTDKQRTR
jgi:hypothetical protein